MSYTTHEPLSYIVTELRAKLPNLTWLPGNAPGMVGTMHGTVEMLSSLIARYDRGEICDLVEERGAQPGDPRLELPHLAPQRPADYDGPMLPVFDGDEEE